MRMIASVAPVTSGELRILGMDPKLDGPRIRARLGVVPQQDTLDMELSVRENLYVYGRYFGIPRAALLPKVAELIDFAQLTERADSRVEPLSTSTTARRPSSTCATPGSAPLSALTRRATLEDVFLRLTGRSLIE